MVTLQTIQAAKARIAPYIYETPVLRLEALDEILGCKVYVKPENLQRTGAFKIRGAMNKMLGLSPQTLQNGVVTASSGNHGKGVAYAAKELGVPATIVLPDTSPQIKRQGILDLGAEIVLCPITERFRVADGVIAEKGGVFIHPFDDYDIIAGQGTIGLELMQQLPDVDMVVVPAGGGGLIGGVSTAVKAVNPKVKLVGCEPAVFGRFQKSVEAGKRIEVAPQKSLADALLTLCPGERNFPLFQSNVDFVADVDEAHIVKGAKLLLSGGRLLAEFSSAIGIGAALQGAFPYGPEDKVCFVVSGGNVDPQQIINA